MPFPEPHWTPLEAGFPDSFVSGHPSDERLRVDYFLDGEQVDGERVVARARFGPEAAGPPGHAHGGAMAAVLDEAMGIAAWVAGHPVVAARLVTEFRRMLPLGTTALVRTTVHPPEGRKVRVTARLEAPDGTLHAEGEALFVHLATDALEALNEIRNRDA